jgi:rhodanese-related sulfurtransferase
MKTPRLLAIACFSLMMVSACTAQTQNSVSPDEFEKDISSKPSIQLLDVRTPGEYFSGHIKQALQADWNDPKEFDRRIAFIDKNKPVYVYCLAGGRSAAAAEKMRKMGYTNVVELKGGINAWKASNKALEGAVNAKQMSVDEFNATIAGSKTVLVDIGAEWCPPCKLMEPVLKKLVDENPGKFTLLKVDGGRDLDILKKYEVGPLPVFMVFKDGKQTWRKEGIADEKEISAQLR